MSEPEKPSQSAVFEQLTRRRGGTSARGLAILLGILSGGGCVWVYLATLAAHEPTLISVVSLSILLLPIGSLVITLLGPFVAGLVSATATVRDVDPEMLQLLRLAHLTPKEIVSGCLLAALYRLRRLWAIYYGLLPPAWSAIAVILSALIAMIEKSPLELMEGAWPAFWIVFCEAVVGTMMNWLAVSVGVSAGLHWRSTGQAAGVAAAAVLAGFIVLAAALFCGLLAVGSLDSLIDLESPGSVYIVWCVVIVASYGVVGYLSLQSARGML